MIVNCNDMILAVSRGQYSNNGAPQEEGITQTVFELGEPRYCNRLLCVNGEGQQIVPETHVLV